MAGITEMLEMSGQNGLTPEEQAAFDAGAGDGLDENLDGGLDDQTPPRDQTPPVPDVNSMKGKRVPLAALHEERTRRQELQNQFESMQEQNNQLAERFTRLLELYQGKTTEQQQQKPAEQEPPAPIFAEDPEGYINWLAGRYDKRVQQLEAQLQQHNQQGQQNQQQQQLVSRVSADEAAFSKKTADYGQAVEFFTQSKASEYAALGLDPYSVQQLVQRDVLGIAQFAASQNKNVGELLYNSAKARGYKAAPQQPPKGQPKQAPTSLNALAGGLGEEEDIGGMSLEKLKGMDDKAFNEWFDQQARKQIQGPIF